jgi:hypothetical protein
MRRTVGELKEFIKDLPDDMEVWIEYPKRYGLAQPEVILEDVGYDGQDFIECMGLFYKDKRLYIAHHY